MSFDPRDRHSRAATMTARVGTRDAVAHDEGLRRHMLRVYNYMGVGVLVTALVSYLVTSVPAIAEPVLAFMATPFGLLLILAPLPFGLILRGGLNSMSPAAAQGIFWSFCALMGVVVGAIMAAYVAAELHTAGTIARAFILASVVFLSMSLWGYTTKKDLTGLGRIAAFAVLGIIVAIIVNLFMGSALMSFLIDIGVVVAFSALTAYETQEIKEVYDSGASEAGNQKLGVLAAFTLYVSFINIFLALLRLTSSD